MFNISNGQAMAACMSRNTCASEKASQEHEAEAFLRIVLVHLTEHGGGGHH